MTITGQTCVYDQLEASKNPFVPGARMLRKADVRRMYVNTSACMQSFYPLSEVNDLALLAYVEKRESTDIDRPWASQAHPDVNLYMYVLRGSGSMTLGVGDPTFEEEVYDYVEGDLIIVPRGVPYKHSGDWDALFVIARTSAFGKVSGTNRFPYATIIYEKPPRPTREEREALPEVGTLLLLDSTGSFGVSIPDALHKPFKAKDLGHLRSDLRSVKQRPLNELLNDITPNDEQTSHDRNRAEARKNPSVLGARVIKRSDAPDCYNGPVSNVQWPYAMSWNDDMGIFLGYSHESSTDVERPFLSHSHPEIEEYRYVLAGSGTVNLGVGDETFETESYEFGPGDVHITPRGVPHQDAGTNTALVFHTKANAFGKIVGDIQYPHPVYIYTKPPRPTQEERDQLHEPGTHFLMDSRETYNVYKPNPILEITSPNAMTFSDEKSA